MVLSQTEAHTLVAQGTNRVLSFDAPHTSKCVSTTFRVGLQSAADTPFTLMSDYSPITLQIVDENASKLIDLPVPFRFEIDVKQVMEAAFVLTQTAAAPDPFLYTVGYYGYSESAQFPGYLGYEIESICGKANNNQFYWALSINGVASSTGADTAYPGPGSTVIWQYTPIPANLEGLTARAKVVQSRRASRSKTQ
jgi:Domain of unknown function (DUF4430)